MKILKMRKRISNAQLQTELVEILKNMFLPQKKLIKQQIEWLIDHKYMKRDEDDINTFIYVAWPLDTNECRRTNDSKTSWRRFCKCLHFCRRNTVELKLQLHDFQQSCGRLLLKQRSAGPVFEPRKYICEAQAFRAFGVCCLTSRSKQLQMRCFFVQ